jgi:type IV/VI secretion system ImpK/VasF family protein
MTKMAKSQTTTATTDRRGKLAFAFQELFTGIVRLRNKQPVSNAEAFRAHMRDAYRLAVQDALARGYSQEAVDKGGYAVIAFLDESAVSSRNYVFANWALSPLSRELFPQISGETFFRTIDELLAAPASAETADLLEVYLLALLLGHRGRYAIGGADELASIMQRVKEKIAAMRGWNLPLSPAWALPAEPIAAPPPDPVRRACFAVALASLALCVATFAISKFLLVSGAAEIHALLK